MNVRCECNSVDVVSTSDVGNISTFWDDLSIENQFGHLFGRRLERQRAVCVCVVYIQYCMPF